MAAPPPTRSTAAQRAQKHRDEKLAHVQEQLDSGQMTRRQLTPDEMRKHAGRREQIQAARRNRKR